MRTTSEKLYSPTPLGAANSGSCKPTLNSKEPESGRSPSPLDSTVLTRIATAIVGIPIIVFIVVVGGIVFESLVALMALGAGWEAFQLLRKRGHSPAFLLGLVMIALLAIALATPHGLLWWQSTLVVGTVVSGFWFLAQATSPEAFLDWTLTVAMSTYIGGLSAALIGIRLFHNGLRIFIVFLVLTWAFDTGAYFVGRTVGRTPFMSHISQSKTLEGVMGGIIAAVLVGLLAAGPAGMRLGTVVVLAVVVAVTAQAGDLVESLLKRYAQVKDSGRLIPGHGGILDRVDSLLFSGAAAYYVLKLAGYH